MSVFLLSKYLVAVAWKSKCNLLLYEPSLFLPLVLAVFLHRQVTSIF